MIRNLVLKLPSLRQNSEYGLSSLYRKRSFRSLSPNQKVRPVASALTERSVSCSRAERGHSRLDIYEKPQARTFCFSKEYYAKNEHQSDADEIHWKENPSTRLENEKQKDNMSFNKQESKFETLDQYELEAAKPRPLKNQCVIDAFKNTSHNPYFHLQPSQIKPYGSQDNFYSPMLLKSANSLKYPRKLKKSLSKDPSEFDTNKDVPQGSHSLRRYSTSKTSDTKISRALYTTKSRIEKQNQSTKNNISEESNLKRNNNLKFTVKLSDLPKSERRKYPQHWATQNQHLEIAPPTYQTSYALKNNDIFIEYSTPAMRRSRKEEENKRGFINYKASYSDLIKLKLKEKEDAKSNKNIVNSTNNKNKLCVSCLLNNPEKSDKMISSFKSLPDRRNITTKSKSDLLLGEHFQQTPPEELKQKRSLSKLPPKAKKSSKYSKSSFKKTFNSDCEDVCTPVLKALKTSKTKNAPYEPAKCEKEITLQKVYLPSKVKLAVPPCTARPPYRDCKDEPPCTTRADECLEVKPKKLPKIPPNSCECVDQPAPSFAPKLEKLNLKFEDPPRVVCPEPPCQTPRADDCNPKKYKPLKPYVAKDCACIPHQPMLDVKLKRLPKCEPEEICRPPRVCPIIDPCPTRADECYKVVPKVLPPLEDPNCPCVEPPRPKIAPPIKRLNLKIPDPERLCPPPTPCIEAERADHHLKIKKKKLPKFVPGDCPCKDRPMVDWKLKRLVCEDEHEECKERVPDPCKAFPRADWGCWEYSEDVCVEVDPKCVDIKNPCETPKDLKPCRKKSFCETGAGPLNYSEIPKRKFSFTSSSSYPRLKQIKCENSVNPNKMVKNEQQKDSKSLEKRAKIKPIKSISNKLASKSALQLLKLLNNCKSSDNISDRLLFKPPKEDKLNYDTILKSIDVSATQLDKKETKTTLKKPKGQILTIPSRAISTTENVKKNETDIQKEKESISKQKCKNVRPSIKSLICKRRCPRHKICPAPEQEHRPCCKNERVPVCCKKEEAPYSSFSDNLEESITPYTNTPQWTCNRSQFGFHPVYNKEHEPLKPKNKTNEKNYSTRSLVAELAVAKEYTQTKKYFATTTNIPDRIFRKQPSKELLNNKSSTYQSRSFATKVFQIRPVLAPKKTQPSKACGEKSRIVVSAPKISSQTEETCKADQRWCCYRNYANPTVRKAPPFPAFSDCLDEEMEDILTECPLDREKYLLMQPRFMNPPKKPLTLRLPPPSQGKIDILKEQECIREKLCIENKGLTQSCSDFGKPIPLMKTKKMFIEENRDCKVIDQLKKKKRWPPFTLKSSRYYSTSACIFNNPQTRNYHALTKSVKKAVFANDDSNLKEIAKKIDKSPKLTKLKSSQEEIRAPKICGQYKIAHKMKRRYYSTNRTRRFNTFNRNISVCRHRLHFYREKRYYKSEKSNKNTLNVKERCRVKTYKNICPKFTLNSCPAAITRKKCHRLPSLQGCSKPFSPYPAYSECKEHNLIDPSCECDYDTEAMPDLQPRSPLLNSSPPSSKEFPNQEKIDRTLGAKYYKCKHDIPNEGQTIKCEDFGHCFNLNRKKHKIPSSVESNSEKGNETCEQNNVVEFLVQEHKPSESNLDETDPCKTDKEKAEEMCIAECLKSIPCDLPEEEKYCLCKKKCQSMLENKQDEVCEQESQSNAKPLEPTCKGVIPKSTTCPPKESKNLSHLETFWQKVVNYFKARPNCPQPGDYKKKVLKEKAEKAASAAGLIAVDPKCLPPDLLEEFKAATKDCKVCPNQEPPKKCGIRSQSPDLSKKKFTPNFQSSRSYSKNMGCKNLEKINKILEEEEVNRRKLLFKRNTLIEKMQYGKIIRAKQNEDLKMSLDVALNKPVDFAKLCYKNENYSKTYFGYTNTLPSRENVLERAWRISIETNNNNNYYYPRGLHGDIPGVDNSSKTPKELEKLKTEDVLRMFDKLLKNEDPDTKNKS